MTLPGFTFRVSLATFLKKDDKLGTSSKFGFITVKVWFMLEI